jgi:hypothetical protein
VLTEVVSGEETSTQPQALPPRAGRRRAARPTIGDRSRPILQAVSGKGSQLTSSPTREFRALRAMAQHVGRPDLV